MKTAASRNRNGFTLIEVLVAVGIFSFVVAIAVGGFARALRSQREIAGLAAANTAASLAVEQMSREVRTGIDFRCDLGLGNIQTCPAGGAETSRIVFTNANFEEVAYCLHQNGVWRGVGSAACGTGASEKITGDNLIVKNLVFTVFGAELGDDLPPRVTIFLGASPTEKTIQSLSVNIQTTVSSRVLDVPPP